MPNLQTLTVKAVAEKLNARPDWVRRLIHSKELKACNIGSSKRPLYRVRKADLDTFIESRTVEGVEEG
ncbi:DNA-binding protein [Marinifilum sp. JC120]|nr:DNA-binding protein [Marinifilum sp. JC120]